MPHHFKALLRPFKTDALRGGLPARRIRHFFVACAGHSKYCHSRVRGQSVCLARVCVFGVSWAWGHKVSRNKVVAITGLDILNFILLSVSLAWKNNPQPEQVAFVILRNAEAVSFTILSSLSSILMMIFFGVAPLGTAWTRTVTSRRFT